MRHLIKILLLGFSSALPFFLQAQNPGEVMFVAVNTDGNDGLAFVTFVPLADGTIIHFNDDEWDGAAFSTGEGTLTWENNTGNGISAGTIIIIDNTNTATPNPSLGIASRAGTFTLGAGNEVVYMFIGSDASTPTTFLSAIANDDFTAGNGLLTNTNLTAGTNAIAITGDEDIMVYAGSTICSSTIAACAANLANVGNWQTEDGAADTSNDGTPPDFPDDVVINFYGVVFEPVTYYSRQTGDWDDEDSWTTSADGSGGPLATGIWPASSDNVVILSGHTITVNAVTDNQASGVSADGLGRANVGAFTGSGDQMFYQTGDILIANGGTLTTSEETMLEGYTFIDDGGTLTINEDLINLGYLEVNTTGDLSATDDLVLSGNSITIINSTYIGSDDIYLDWTDATLCGSGTANLGNGGPDPTVQFFNGSSLAQVCSTFSITCTANCGAFPITPTGNFISGNTGPGGVGNSGSNELWLKADDLSLSDGAAVTTWTDASGNALSATQGTAANQPVFNTNDVNGVLPSISFDGLANPNGDFLNLGTPASLNLIPGTDSWSFFIVYNVPDLEQGTFFSKAESNTATRQYQYTSDDAAGTSRFTAYIGGDGDIGSKASTNGWFVAACLNNTTQKISWTNAEINFTQGVGAGQVQAAEVLIGARRDTGPTTGTGFELEGSIAEIAMYSALTDSAQRIIITNYLAAKYDIALPRYDLYTMDNGANGDFDFEVAGIGLAGINDSKHLDAKGTGMIRMWNPSSLTSGTDDFLFWGHDNGALVGQTADVDGTVVEERLTRVWRVSETADVGTVSISFDITPLSGSPIGENLRLLIDRNGNGFFDNDVTPISGSFVNNTVSFSGVNFTSGDRFTLGNTDAANPLPIELLSFEVIPHGQTVLISWSTLTETNNDFFTVERSKDAKIWEDAIRKPGAGNSKVRINYSTTDDGPYQGVSYYRLKQTDFDGKFTYSKLRRVVIEYTREISVYPNPFDNTFIINAPFDVSPHLVRLSDITGRQISFDWVQEDSKIKIRADRFPPGIYMLRVSDGLLTKTIRVVRK